MAIGNRRHISADVKRQLVYMSASLKPCEIAHITGISKRAINRLLELHRRTGCVVKKPLQSGRPRMLNALDIAYLEGLIERSPDLYLSELQAALLEARGVDASEETIRRSLLHR
ncbi:hypothetical protein BDZ97DRAFT_1677231 [Flammula alnicola]|nr:hypothetical protein BDZ97DRAFT_1677231 [Flammula alnicola]